MIISFLRQQAFKGKTDTVNNAYSPDIPADCTIYTPGIGTHSITVSSPRGRIQHLCTLLQLQPIIII